MSGPVYVLTIADQTAKVTIPIASTCIQVVKSALSKQIKQLVDTHGLTNCVIDTKTPHHTTCILPKKQMSYQIHTVDADRVFVTQSYRDGTMYAVIAHNVSNQVQVISLHAEEGHADDVIAQFTAAPETIPGPAKGMRLDRKAPFRIEQVMNVHPNQVCAGLPAEFSIGVGVFPATLTWQVAAYLDELQKSRGLLPAPPAPVAAPAGKEAPIDERLQTDPSDYVIGKDIGQLQTAVDKQRKEIIWLTDMILGLAAEVRGEKSLDPGIQLPQGVPDLMDLAVHKKAQLDAEHPRAENAIPITAVVDAAGENIILQGIE